MGGWVAGGFEIKANSVQFQFQLSVGTEVGKIKEIIHAMKKSCKYCRDRQAGKETSEAPKEGMEERENKEASQECNTTTF